MPDNLYKAGQQTQADPWEFTLSDPTPDSYGDIVEPDWRLSQFQRNPIALWMHDHRTPIGVWENVRMEGDKLKGRLKLAARGTSEFIDTLWSLVEQRILRAVSVGFRPAKAEPRDPDDPFSGYRLSGNMLLETSLVSIGANPNALNVRGASADVIRRLSEVGEMRCVGGACEQLRDRSTTPTITRTDRGTRKMNLNDRIKQKEQLVADLQGRVDELLSRADSAGGITDDIQDEMDALADEREREKRQLATLKRLEDAEIAKLDAGKQKPEEPKPQQRASGAPVQRAPRVETRQDRPKGHKAIMAFAAIAKSYAERSNPLDIVHRDARDEDGLDILVRAATAPAVTGTTGWAGNMVQEEWGEFVGLLRDESVYGQIPGMRIDLTAVTNMPIQAGRGNLAAGFVAENGGIPVVEGSIGTKSLQPHKMGIISAHSKEMLRRSTVANIGTVIRDQIIGDTAEAIDTALFGSTARSAGTNPAGLQDTTETGSANVVAATNSDGGAGNATVAEILSDTNSLLARVNAIKARTGTWLMHPKQVRGLEVKQDGTTGHFVFRDEVMQGRFRGFPIIMSTNVTDGVTVFVANGAMAFGSEMTPMFEESSDATLHFEGAAGSVSSIGTAGTPNTVAAPAINLFQQDLLAIKMTLGLDWRVIREAGVQCLTSTTGW